MTERFSFDSDLDARCRCGGTVHVGRATSSGTGELDNTEILLHSMPPCKEFERLDPISYMRWLRGATDV